MARGHDRRRVRGRPGRLMRHVLLRAHRRAGKLLVADRQAHHQHRRDGMRLLEFPAPWPLHPPGRPVMAARTPAGRLECPAVADEEYGAEYDYQFAGMLEPFLWDALVAAERIYSERALEVSRATLRFVALLTAEDGR